MHIESLKTILSRDIFDLKDIVDILEPGYCLSKIEVQILKSRITSLTNEIEELLTRISDTNNSVIINNAVNNIEKPNKMSENFEKKLSVNPKACNKKSIETDNLQKKDIEVNQSIESENKNPILKPNTIVVVEDVKDTETIENPKIDLETIIQVPINPQPPKDEKQIKIEHSKENPKRKTLADQYIDSTFSLNEMVGQSEISNDRASILGRNPIGDMHKAIKLNDKIGFIRDLFDGDSQKYINAIDKLNSFDDFEQAMEFLNINFSWDQNSDSFKMFIDIVYRRFIQ